jgi:serpin B
VSATLRARRLGAVALTGALALAGLTGGSAASAGAPSARAAATTAASAENAFALNILRLVGGSGNVVYSPYSVDAALTMAGAGAEGPTAAQIDHVLGAPSVAAADANAAALRRAIGAAASVRQRSSSRTPCGSSGASRCRRRS